MINFKKLINFLKLIKKYISLLLDEQSDGDGIGRGHRGHVTEHVRDRG